jgi:hypothetical protein
LEKYGLNHGRDNLPPAPTANNRNGPLGSEIISDWIAGDRFALSVGIDPVLLEELSVQFARYIPFV